MTKTQTILEKYKADNTLTNREIAEEISCSTRMVRRVLNPIRESKPERASIKANTPAKILLFDIETSPLEFWGWKLWQQFVGPHQILKDWAILAWSAKWLFTDKVMGERVTPEEGHDRTDESVMEPLWKLIDEADIVVTHNGNRFDLPRINTRFILNGFLPPSPYRSVDTNAVVKRTFQFTSNKMDLINRSLGILTKLEHEGMDMWHKCVSGNSVVAEPALDNMLRYNKQDVLALEDLYLALRPWIKSHPNVNLYQEFTGEKDEVSCANCGSHDITWNSKYYTPAGRFEAFRCDSCGAIGRSRYSDLSTDERKSLGMSVAY